MGRGQPHRSSGGRSMIEVRGLTKRYGPTLAVDGLSFDVEPGKVTGFLGPNGAGKSTTMRVVQAIEALSAGLSRTKGSVKHGLRDPRSLPGWPKWRLTRTNGAPRGNRTPNPLILAADLSLVITSCRIPQQTEDIGD